MDLLQPELANGAQIAAEQRKNHSLAESCNSVRDHTTIES